MLLARDLRYRSLVGRGRSTNHVNPFHLVAVDFQLFHNLGDLFFRDRAKAELRADPHATRANATTITPIRKCMSYFPMFGREAIAPA